MKTKTTKDEIPTQSNIKLIQLRASDEMHKEIKSYAAIQGLSITALMLAAYQEYRTNHSPLSNK